MAVDYDLVVLGDTATAREAALKAARQGARVALVGATTGRISPSLVELTLAMAARGSGGAQTAAGGSGGSGTDLWASAAWQPNSWEAWRQGLGWVQETFASHLSAAALAVAGVDVVSETGQFSPPPLALVAGDRCFSARHYLIATGSYPTLPAIPGLATAPWITPEQLPTLPHQPASVAVLGAGTTAIALAQSLALLGTRTTLISRGPRLLPTEDRDLAHWLAWLLRSAGVDVHCPGRLQGIRVERTTALIDLETPTPGTSPLRADYICLATRPTPAVHGLQLPQVGVECDRLGLGVDEYLRTSHPRIWAVGSVLGGYRAPAVGRHEVAIALHNALYLPQRRVNYGLVPYAMATIPPWGRVGLTEQRARRCYGEAVWSVTLPLESHLQIHLQGPALGVGKLVGLKNGRLLGAHFLAPQAEELVQTLALLMGQGLRVQQMAHFPAIPHSLTELLVQAADQWQDQRWQPGGWRRDWAENWFNWRRNRCQ